MSKEDLPSIDDLVNNDLPSVEDFITEENAEELPSVEDFIEIEESTQTIEDADGNTFAEVQDIVPPWPELVRMINDVRADIPDIPEVKYYDKELEELAEQISNLPEVRYYDREVEAICDQVDLVREQIKGLPEVKYYDEQVDVIEDRIDTLQTEVANLPEVKYYDAEIAAICEAIDAVKASIPQFPKWVNEVNEVPDFSWIGKTFSVIDDDFVKVNDTIEGLRGKVQFDLEQLSEDVETKHFNSTVKIENDISNLSEKVDTRIDEEKDKIWKELRSSSLKMWEYHKEFKDDDRKLKKQILGEYNTLKQNINKELKEINYTSTKTDELLLKYFTELREEISGLPEVKYYDKDIDYVKSDIKGLYKLVEEIKSSQKQLKEEQQLLAETNVPLGEDPPETNNPDPLTPLDQDFVTLDQLQKHYKIFVERVQYQLSSIGGGGAGFIKDLDDVDITGLADNYILQYDSSVSKWKTVANSGSAGAGGTWASNAIGIHTTKNVGIATTARSDFALYVEGNQYVDGNVTIGGTLRTENKINVDSIGIVTARTQINVGYDYESGPGVGVTILSSGNADYAGIVTASTVKASTAFYPPLYTTSARDAGTFTQGAIIFNTTSSKLEFYDGTNWQSLPGMSLGLTVALDG
jgi:muconolactone delta-isomerase